MSRLVIKDIGPIKYVDITLNKINVFIGQQSSGKSTIAKIISYCSWLEKKNGGNRRGMLEELVAYHRLKGYFQNESAFMYLGENVNYVYHPLQISDLPSVFKEGGWKTADEILIYAEDKSVNPKVAYIPAERNFVAALPNAKKYAEEADNLLNFIEDWLEAKHHYPTNKAIDIMNLGVKFYYNEQKDRDVLLLENGEAISLSNASSGLQSLVPLMVFINWLSGGIYEENKPYSPEEIMKMKSLLADWSKEHKDGVEQQQFLARLNRFMSGKGYTHTQFVIEEPEQNLFPKTQVDFLYFLLSMINHGRPHRLVLTTHSPYILYALNNCLLASVVEENLDEEIKRGISATQYAISPCNVSVWQIENGCLCNEQGEINRTIQDEQGLIRKNYFNNIMKQVMGEFNELLNYYE